MDKKEEIISTNNSEESTITVDSLDESKVEETNDVKDNNEVEAKIETETNVKSETESEVNEEIETKNEDENKEENKETNDSTEDKKEKDELEETTKAIDDTNTSNSETISKNSHKKSIIVSISVIAIIVLFLLFSTIFALLNSNNTKIINGITINGIDVSGLTKEEALVKVSDVFNKKTTDSITLKHNEYKTNIIPSQFDVSFSLEDAVDTAYNTGRSDNIFENNYQILASLLFGTKIKPDFSYNEDTFNSLINEMQVNFKDRLIEANYYIDNNNLVLSKGNDGIVIDKDALKNEFTYIITNPNCKTTEIDIPTKYEKATTLDLNTVHNEVCKKPTDAYFITQPYTIYPHSDGIDFAISMEEAQAIFNEKQGNCSIPLKIIPANVKISDLGKEAFPDLLATYSTTYSTRNVNRSTNIRLSSQKIDGTVIMPGETFSYNTIVGQRTAAAGYKTAAVYSAGKVTEGIGGGICQVSSTLYNSALLSNLEIVERYNHYFNPGYVPAGRDATVSWGGPDFKFKNNRDYPIKIVCSGTNGKVQVDIYGLKKENDYTVEIQSYITRYIGYRTVEEKDPSLYVGQTKVIENGSSGCQAVCYRILKQNGNVVSKTLLSNDIYSPHNKIVAVGTKPVPAAPAPTPPTPSVTPEAPTTPDSSTPDTGANTNTPQNP